jgi:hypothetical protein
MQLDLKEHSNPCSTYDTGSWDEDASLLLLCNVYYNIQSYYMIKLAGNEYILGRPQS